MQIKNVQQQNFGVRAGVLGTELIEHFGKKNTSEISNKVVKSSQILSDCFKRGEFINDTNLTGGYKILMPNGKMYGPVMDRSIFDVIIGRKPKMESRLSNLADETKRLYEAALEDAIFRRSGKSKLRKLGGKLPAGYKEINS